MDYDRAAALAQYRFAMTEDMVAQRRHVRAALRLQRGERVLEVGCGNGFLLRDMAGEVGPQGHVTGADLSSAMIAMASDHCAGLSNIGLSTADAVRLPYEANSFDAATTVQCLCFVPDVAAALSEFHRVLRPGGRLVILDTDWDSWVWNSTTPDLMNRMMNLYRGIYADARLPRSLPRLLQSAGFEHQDHRLFTILNRQLDANSYSGHQVPFIKSFASGKLPPEQIAEWEDSILATSATGDYLFSLARSIFTAKKPLQNGE